MPTGDQPSAEYQTRHERIDIAGIWMEPYTRLDYIERTKAADIEQHRDDSSCGLGCDSPDCSLIAEHEP